MSEENKNFSTTNNGDSPTPGSVMTETASAQEQIPLADPAKAAEPSLEPAVAVAEENISKKPAEKPVEEKIIPPASGNQPPEKIKTTTIIGIIIVLVAILGLIYAATRNSPAPSGEAAGQKVRVSENKEQGKVNIIEETKNDISVLVSNPENPAYPQIKVTVFLGNTEKNPNSADCSLTYPLEREIDKRYDSNMINTVVGLLQPLSAAEKEQGYVSAIPAGTILKYLKLDDSGVMSVNLSGAISQAAGSCAVAAIKAEIKDTLRQFAAVKSVVICIDGNCNEDRILQP